MSADGSATPPSAERPLRVAVVGAGPAGIYAADALTRQDDVPVAVDLIDRLPTPFGLVRHGIAPDHPKMRAIRDTLHRFLEHPLVRFVGNVEVGVDISLDDLRRHVDAVIYTYGAALDRHLGIEGEDLPGSLAATDLVAWYTGHPDADRARIEAALAGVRSVVVVGVGNVALDVGRVLARTGAELESDRHAAARPRHPRRDAGRGDHRARPAWPGAGVLHHPGAARARRPRVRDRARRPRRPRTRPGRRGAGRGRPQRHPEPRRPPRLGRPRARPRPHAAAPALLRAAGARARRGPGDRGRGGAHGRGRRGPRRGHRRGRRAAGRPRRPLGGVLRHAAPGAAGRRAHRNGAQRGRAGAPRRTALARRVRGGLDQAGTQRGGRHQQARRAGDRRVAARRRRRRDADGAGPGRRPGGGARLAGVRSPC